MVNKFNLGDNVQPVYTQPGNVEGSIIGIIKDGNAFVKRNNIPIHECKSWNEHFGTKWLTTPMYEVELKNPQRYMTVEDWCRSYDLEPEAAYNEHIVKLYERIVAFKYILMFCEEDLASCD